MEKGDFLLSTPLIEAEDTMDGIIYLDTLSTRQLGEMTGTVLWAIDATNDEYPEKKREYEELLQRIQKEMRRREVVEKL